MENSRRRVLGYDAAFTREEMRHSRDGWRQMDGGASTDFLVTDVKAKLHRRRVRLRLKPFSVVRTFSCASKSSEIDVPVRDK
jgi:hypothetical protein